MKKAITALAAVAVLALTGCTATSASGDQARFEQALTNKRNADAMTLIATWQNMPFDKQTELCLTWRGMTAQAFVNRFNSLSSSLSSDGSTMDSDVIIDLFQSNCGNPGAR